MKKIVSIIITVSVVGILAVGTFLFTSNEFSEKNLVPNTQETKKELVPSTQIPKKNLSIGEAKNIEKRAPEIVKLSSVTPSKALDNNKLVKVNSEYKSHYATKTEVEEVSGNYSLDYFTMGKNSKLSNEISSITIGLDGVVLNDEYNGKKIYINNEKMKVWSIGIYDFRALFGVSPESQGIDGKSFKVYSIGKVFIYLLSNKNILFSFDNIAGTTLNTTNNMAPSNISEWYGSYIVQEKVGQLNGYNTGGFVPKKIQGQKLIMTAKEYKYEKVDIRNPKYYLLKISPSAILGTSYSGASFLNGSVYCIAVMNPEYKMSNQIYKEIPSYVGCTSGAWAANIVMPVILGANGKVQVFNQTYQIYNTSKID